MRRSIAILNPARLSVERSQLLVQNADGRHSVPIEDLGIIVLDNAAIDLTGPLLGRLGSSKVSLVVCGDKHLPAGIFLPYDGHTLTAQILRGQIEASKPAKKRIWQTIVREKIRSQARHLMECSGKDFGLSKIADQVFSGDSTNREAAAATVYFSRLFGRDFARLRQDEVDQASLGPERLANALLNYGYAVIRAAVARAVVLAGLHPALGIQHHHRENSFALADDLMEPLRVLVDRETIKIAENCPDTSYDLTPDLKRQILRVLASEVGWDGGRWPLDSALEAYAAQVRQCLLGEKTELKIPIA